MRAGRVSARLPPALRKAGAESIRRWEARLRQLPHPDRLTGVGPKMLAVTLFGKLQSGCPPEKGGLSF